MLKADQNFYLKSADYALNYFGSVKNYGLDEKSYKNNIEKFGLNVISQKKKRSIFAKIRDALSEPMLLILLFAFAITFGVNLGRFFKVGEADFTECLGIVAAVVLSVFITLFMEGSSEKAFSSLEKMYGDSAVKAIRRGETILVKKSELTVGDIMILESGDKVVADARIISATDFTVDESALTGESVAVEKSTDALPQPSPLAERKNCVYSGTFVASGEATAVVTAIGDFTEMGKIADELKTKPAQSPLEQKLARLGKTITLIGVFFAALVFVVTLIKNVITGGLDFSGIQSLFISCIVLIVAAVPEGLPTIVAVSLALNMIKLAKENALIKKMTATETAGAVSVICSDKTGTLTTGEMQLEYFFKANAVSPEKITDTAVLQNFICNSTVTFRRTGVVGSGTEKALAQFIPYSIAKTYRDEYAVIKRVPFSSKQKTMTTVIDVFGTCRTLVKGAPENVLRLVFGDELSEKRAQIESGIKREQKKAKRVLCFAHDDGSGYVFDGYAVIKDEVRKDAVYAVKECKKAGIKVKMLTGDNYVTALAVAKELKIADDENCVINASEIENMDEQTLKRTLQRITVVARSTPIVKLRVVNALKSMGEVVAVTGDGINDAPAVKQADMGVAMGKNGSEITKEAADVILLDDSFVSIVKAVSFGRNVYKNIQRFILFQLSVNVSSLVIITACALFGIQSPFNTLGLLWINVIMDGPPALTLGFESVGDRVMHDKPVKRDSAIVSKKMLARIILNSAFMSAAVLAQIFFNYLSVKEGEKKAVAFTMFILFQLFNAFNCRKLGTESVFKDFSKNKIMLVTFAAVFLLQVLIVQTAYKVFAIEPLSAVSWIKILAVSSTIILINEAYKIVYRLKRDKITCLAVGFKSKKSYKKFFRNKKQSGA